MSGRAVAFVGVGLVAVGGFLMLGGRLAWVGRLPGDFHFGGEGWSLHAPLATSLLLSVVLSLVLWLVGRR